MMKLQALLTLVFSIASISFSSTANAVPTPQSLKVTGLDYSHPGGISHEPSDTLSVELTLKNTGDQPINLSQARWKVTLSRERMIEPRNFREARFQDVETVEIADDLGLTDQLVPGDETAFRVSFDPGRYGFFFIQFSPDGTDESWVRLCGMAVVRPPVQGPRPLSYYQADGILLNPDAKALILNRYGIKKFRTSQRLSPERNPDGSYDWSPVDRVMEAAERNDLLAQATLMPVAFFDPPTLGDQRITYFQGKKWNSIVPRENLGPVDQPGTFAHYVQTLLSRYDNLIESAIIRNEPWEGGSISNWHATSAYMREALDHARQVIDELDADVKLLGTDSIDNTIDQVAIAHQIELLDGITHHPYGTKFRDTHAPAQAAGWGLNVYDNESWLAPEDMSIVAGNTMKLASGYRLMHSVKTPGTIPVLNNNPRELVSPRPIGQPIGTWLHFVEDTEYAEELLPDTLPHVHLLRGRPGAEEKHVAALFGRVKLYGHRAHNEAVGDEVFPQLRGNGSLRLSDPDRTLRVFDMFGNELPRETDEITLTLDEYPYYLTSTRGYDDLKAKLLKLKADYDDAGVELAMQDMTQRLASKPEVRVHVANRVPSTQTVNLELVAPEGWAFEESMASVTLAPGEKRVIAFKPIQTRPSPLNGYEFTVKATTEGGTRELTETLRVAVFEKGTPTIDGKLDEWAKLGAVPTYMSGEPIEVDYQQQMWFPTLNLQGRDTNDVWARFAGMWDENYFYIGAEVFDPTPGSPRLFQTDAMALTHAAPHDEMYWTFAIPGWGHGTPDDQKMDGLKIAFDVLPVGQKEDPLFPKDAQARMDTRFHRIGPDYEYDLYLGQPMELAESYSAVLARHLKRLENPSDKKYRSRNPPFEAPVFRPVGEPVEQVWRRIAPGVPRHRFYPFSPRWDKDQGPVETAKIKIVRDGDFIRYEAAIPWSELDRVAPELGREVKFAYFIWDRNDLALNWAKDRSIAGGAIQLLIPFKEVTAIETPWRFIDDHQ